MRDSKVLSFPLYTMVLAVSPFPHFPYISRWFVMSVFLDACPVILFFSEHSKTNLTNRRKLIIHQIVFYEGGFDCFVGFRPSLSPFSLAHFHLPASAMPTIWSVLFFPLLVVAGFYPFSPHAFVFLLFYLFPPLQVSRAGIFPFFWFFRFPLFCPDSHPPSCCVYRYGWFRIFSYAASSLRCPFSALSFGCIFFCAGSAIGLSVCYAPVVLRDGGFSFSRAFFS